MNIEIKTIPHKDQRYNTCGDYWQFYNDLNFRISQLGDIDMEFLVTIHELIEEHLTRKHNIREEDITSFDKRFEREREAGGHDKMDESGADPRAPYRREHSTAEGFERILAAILNVDWEEYGQRIAALE